MFMDLSTIWHDVKFLILCFISVVFNWVWREAMRRFMLWSNLLSSCKFFKFLTMTLSLFWCMRFRCKMFVVFNEKVFLFRRKKINKVLPCPVMNLFLWFSLFNPLFGFLFLWWIQVMHTQIRLAHGPPPSHIMVLDHLV